MLSLLIGCGLRRAELLGLTMNSIQLREEHWVIADLVGKGGHIRTVLSYPGTQGLRQGASHSYMIRVTRA